MYRIAPTLPVLPSDLVRRAAAIEAATLGHMVNHGFAPGIHAVTSADHFVGTALTVRLSDMDAAALHHAVDEVQPGHVVVVDMGSDTGRACVGAMIAYALAIRGAAGIIVDGAATDIADLEASGVPVFARGLSNKTTRMLGIEGDVNLPVTIGDAVVRPGDLVLADRNGVLFLDPAEFDSYYDRVLAAEATEDPARAELRAGARLSDLFGAAEHIRRSAIHLP